MKGVGCDGDGLVGPVAALLSLRNRANSWFCGIGPFIACKNVFFETSAVASGSSSEKLVEVANAFFRETGKLLWTNLALNECFRLCVALGNEELGNQQLDPAFGMREVALATAAGFALGALRNYLGKHPVHADNTLGKG